LKLGRAGFVAVLAVDRSNAQLTAAMCNLSRESACFTRGDEGIDGV
jgi:hypothetical protein